ncbi:MAG: mechanosensitive ion channel family protein [Cephaloticoccus sp.]|nr:mechanosensitive ion channel family protein [Cephaloticoccus sp.]MCF7759119.1 mechanosensitive ion channel family protein [Cephaloticoccus sp.]
MESLLNLIRDWLAGSGLTLADAGIAATGLGVGLLLILAWLGNLVAKRVILSAVTSIVKYTRFQWDDALLKSGVFTRLSHLAPAMVINAFGDDVLGTSPEVLNGVNAAVTIYLTFILISVFFAILDAIQAITESRHDSGNIPIKGFFQAVKLIATLLGLIMVLATILNKSPLYLLSGLGALTAVLLLVFRDAILGFVAGIMISVNNMVRVGDWIEMPKAGADGDVIDVSLTTVKVQNWDKTITTIPTYNLISDSFKNWRGMAEAGGRRIKRSLFLDVQSIRFADEELVERWGKIDLLKDYLKQKREEIEEANKERGTDLAILGNGRRITNVGTFRAYCVAYLKAHPQIHQEMTFLVRQLAPTEHGLPLEIYVFSKDTVWANYEAIQADIFDHMLAVIGEFDLRIYQQPSGRDVQSALAQVADRK